MKTSIQSALRCAIFASAVSVCTTLPAQSSTADTPTAKEHRATTSTYGDTKLSHGDRSFFEKAAKSGTKEVAVSQSVLEHLGNPQVKAFAQMMVSEHSAANAELQALAAKKGVALPAKDMMKLENKWSKKTKDIDDDYMKEMVDDHEDTVKLFEKAAKSEDADIAAFAQKTLPTLQQHLTSARDLKKMVK